MAEKSTDILKKRFALKLVGNPADVKNQRVY
jgi:hypothetical protein